MHSKEFGQKRSCLILRYCTGILEPGCSVSIVSGYGLDDRAIEVRSPAEAKGFYSSLRVQTGSEAHTASCPVGTEGPFPGGKARSGRDADHSHLVPRSKMSRSYASSPPKRFVACNATALYRHSLRK
jgi:hypothetical protein